MDSTPRDRAQAPDKPAANQQPKPGRAGSGRGAASALEALRRVEQLRDRLGRRTWPEAANDQPE